MRALLLPLLALAAGCGGVVFHPADRVDADGDGFFDPGSQDSLAGLTVEELRAASLDCDDDNDNVFPGAAELCDGRDNDCDGLFAREEQDVDGDGFTICGLIPGTFQRGTDVDCNDDPNLFGAFQAPDLEEICAMPPVSGLSDVGVFDARRPTLGLDDNCDGELAAGEEDFDQDGHASCELVDIAAPEGDALEEDCNDAEATINPSVETASCVDDSELGTNCQPVPDTERIQWYPDFDRDGDGNLDTDSHVPLCAGNAPADYDGTNYLPDPLEDGSVPHGDCEDLIAQINSLDLDGDTFSTCEGDVYPGGVSADNEPLANPDQLELCDQIDNDLDGQTDEDFDQDLDGSFTDLANDPNGCISSYGIGGIDCDDASPAANSLDLDNDGVSTCDGDCNDGNPDVSATDNDGDGFDTCSAPIDCDDFDATLTPLDLDGDGFTSCGGDCDDANADVNPSITVQCDAFLDSNCDGLTDPLESDDDGDGSSECEGDCNDSDPLLAGADADGDGHSTCAGDCDDGDAGVFPGASLLCDDVADTDCNGVTDANEADLDGDGSTVCGGDCNDSDPSVDGADADGDGSTTCDGDCDDGDAAVTHSTDDDGDGWTACPAGVVPADCDDSDPVLNHSDADGDTVTTCAPSPDCDDTDPSLQTLDVDGDNQDSCAGDCDDGNPAIKAGLPDLRDGIDNDCDGTADETLISAGDLAVVEILVASAPASGDAAAEYIEVFNKTGLAIDLRGWEVVVGNDATGGSATFGFAVDSDPAAARVVPANGRVALARSGNASVYGFDVADYYWGAASFGNDGGSLDLVFGATTVDSMTWQGTGCESNCGPGNASPSYSTDSTWRPAHAMGLSTAAVTSGDPAGANDLQANWCEERDPLGPEDYGSPGSVPGALGPCTAD